MPYGRSIFWLEQLWSSASFSWYCRKPLWPHKNAIPVILETFLVNAPSRGYWSLTNQSMVLPSEPGHQLGVLVGDMLEFQADTILSFLNCQKPPLCLCPKLLTDSRSEQVRTADSPILARYWLLRLPVHLFSRPLVSLVPSSLSWCFER